MKYSELYRLLEKQGWKIVRTGKHHMYVLATGAKLFFVKSASSFTLPKWENRITFALLSNAY